jgi:hypothetical protein
MANAKFMYLFNANDFLSFIGNPGKEIAYINLRKSLLNNLIEIDESHELPPDDKIINKLILIHKFLSEKHVLIPLNLNEIDIQSWIESVMILLEYYIREPGYIEEIEYHINFLSEDLYNRTIGRGDFDKYEEGLHKKIYKFLKRKLTESNSSLEGGRRRKTRKTRKTRHKKSRR